MHQLDELTRTHTMQPFALIYIGQPQPKDARSLIKAYPNIYFLTSHANTVAIHKSAQPWINMFDGVHAAAHGNAERLWRLPPSRLSV